MNLSDIITANLIYPPLLYGFAIGLLFASPLIVIKLIGKLIDKLLFRK